MQPNFLAPVYPQTNLDTKYYTPKVTPNGAFIFEINSIQMPKPNFQNPSNFKKDPSDLVFEGKQVIVEKGLYKQVRGNTDDSALLKEKFVMGKIEEPVDREILKRQISKANQPANFFNISNSNPVLPSYQLDANIKNVTNPKKRPQEKILTQLTIENIDSNFCFPKPIPINQGLNENEEIKSENKNLTKENEGKKIIELKSSPKDKNLVKIIKNSNEKNVINQSKYNHIRKLIGNYSGETIQDLLLCNSKHTSLIKYINKSERKLYCNNCLQGSKNSVGDVQEIKEYITSYSDEISKTIKETTEEIERFSFASCVSNNDKLIEKITQEFDKYIQMIICLKRLTIELIQKQLESKEQSFEELMVDISDVLEEKNKELRCSFTSKNYMDIFTCIDEKLIQKLKSLLSEVKNRLRISSLKCQEPFNFIKINDINSESMLSKIGIFISSNYNSNDSKLINWSNKSNIFKKNIMMSPQTITSSFPLIIDGSFSIRINSLNAAKQIAFGISKFELDLSDSIDFISDNEGKIIIIFSPNQNSRNPYLLPSNGFKEADKITFMTNEGYISLVLNDTYCLVNKFKIPFHYPFFPLVTLYEEHDEVVII